MDIGRAVAVLIGAAVLEVGGDALVRLGLQTAGPGRAAYWAAAMAALFGYALTVNAPGWEFGRLLGVYVVVFFVIAQVVDAFVFGHGPAPAIWLGGALIVAGGAVIVLGGP